MKPYTKPQRRAWREQSRRRVLAVVDALGPPPPRRAGREDYWRRVAERAYTCAVYARKLYREAERQR